jgi:hypothetical protein
LPDSGFANVGTAAGAEGPAASNGVVSLGDGGIATLTFDPPITNGDGFDFAVFENTFLDTFLELAFVEVSTDSLSWARFPSKSLTQTQTQTWAFGFTQPTQIHNLAGKYRHPFGTPFDLQDLAMMSNIRINEIKYVRIIDVVGSIDSILGNKDSDGRIINDPWPTPFPSSGFDLDAVGVIHQIPLNSTSIFKSKPLLGFDPTSQQLVANSDQPLCVSIYNLHGQMIQNLTLSSNSTHPIDLPTFSAVRITPSKSSLPQPADRHVVSPMGTFLPTNPIFSSRFHQNRPHLLGCSKYARTIRIDQGWYTFSP